MEYRTVARRFFRRAPLPRRSALCAGAARAAAALALGSAALAAVSCGAQAKPLTVNATSFQFQPATIEVQAGQPVKLTLRNGDVLEHDFQVDQLPLKAGSGSHAGHSGGGGADQAALHVHADAGKATSTTFTPTQRGTYTVYCTVPGHKEAGMTATLVVR